MESLGKTNDVENVLASPPGVARLLFGVANGSCHGLQSMKRTDRSPIESRKRMQIHFIYSYTYTYIHIYIFCGVVLGVQKDEVGRFSVSTCWWQLILFVVRLPCDTFALPSGSRCAWIWLWECVEKLMPQLMEKWCVSHALRSVGFTPFIGWLFVVFGFLAVC